MKKRSSKKHDKIECVSVHDKAGVEKQLENIKWELVGGESGFRPTEEQEKFLELVTEQGVCVHMSEAGKKDPRFQELVGLLSDMHKDGRIPSFSTVEEE